MGGWVLEASDWDLTELGREDDNSLSALTGSNSLGVGGQMNGGGFPVDLGLGRLGDLAVGTVEKLKEPRVSNGTRVLNGNQHPSCLVDGCKSDLRNSREYHRRHRVCERHSKTPVVIVGGREQRFCQQCSRFHSLGEFDEVKRSCRKRLDGHNRRRRKLQPESLYTGSRSALSNHQGARLLQFGGPQDETTTGGSSLTWPSVDKHHQQFHVIVQQSVPSNSFSFSYGGRNKQVPFFLANPEIGNQTAAEVSASRGLLNNNASPESGSGHLNILPGKLTHLVESKRALSLLSTHPTQTPGTSLRHLGQQNVFHLNQTAGTGLQFNGLAQYSHSQGTEKPVDAVLATNAGNIYNNCNEMSHVGPDEMLENGASQLLSFSWN